MQKSFTDRVRSFNRTVTLGTGALDDSYLGRGRPLGQARLLFEIEADGTDITSLRTRLDLDSGYASRLLKALESEGLVVIEEDRNDRRRRLVRPTAKGLAEQAAYDSLSDVLVTSLLDRLNEPQRNRLVEAMGEVERLLTAGSIVIAAEPEDSPDAQRCISAYFSELAERFEGGFDPDAGGYAGKVAETPAHGVFLLARLHGKAVGCGGLKQFDDRTGEIKRMWVAPEVRGLGLSRRLLEALEAEAVRAGMTRVILDTNRSLAEAQSLYRKAGYRQIERYNDNAYADFWFEKRVGR